MRIGRERFVPSRPGKIASGGIHNAMTPVDAEHALAPHLRRQIHVALCAMNVKLRQPHPRVILQPGYWPALAALQLSKYLIHGVPSQTIVQARKHDVLREFFVEVLEVASHPAPAGQNHAFLRCIPAKEVMSLKKGSRGERYTGLAALP